MTKNKLVVVRQMPGLRVKVVAERCDRLALWICTCYVDDEPYAVTQTEDAFATAQSMIETAAMENDDLVPVPSDLNVAGTEIFTA